MDGSAHTELVQCLQVFMTLVGRNIYSTLMKLELRALYVYMWLRFNLYKVGVCSLCIWFLACIGGSCGWNSALEHRPRARAPGRLVLFLQSPLSSCVVSEACTSYTSLRNTYWWCGYLGTFCKVMSELLLKSHFFFTHSYNGQISGATTLDWPIH